MLFSRNYARIPQLCKHAKTGKCLLYTACFSDMQMFIRIFLIAEITDIVINFEWEIYGLCLGCGRRVNWIELKRL
jgi:hypothetical protein